MVRYKINFYKIKLEIKLYGIILLSLLKDFKEIFNKGEKGKNKKLNNNKDKMLIKNYKIC